jgi:hypothetical protein
MLTGVCVGVVGDAHPGRDVVGEPHTSMIIQKLLWAAGTVVP